MIEMDASLKEINKYVKDWIDIVKRKHDASIYYSLYWLNRKIDKILNENQKS